MKKILVPTDFSENSNTAFLYALELAERMDATVSIVHVYHPSAHHLNEWVIPTEEEFIKKSYERLDEFVQSGFKKTIEGVVVADMVEQQVISGFALDELVELSKSGDYDMIVMGSTGSSDVLDRMFGKVSTHVAEFAECPVVLVPKTTTFQPVKKIMYGSDYESSERRVLQKLSEFANLFEAEVHLVHVYDEKEKQPNGMGVELIKGTFENKAPELDFELHAMTSDSVSDGLQVYAQDHGMNWMVIAKPKKKFWQRWLHRSVTKEIVMNPNIPLMILH